MNNLQVGDKVFYTEDMKGLPPGSIGVITNIYLDKATVSYPQFEPRNMNGKFIFSNHIYAHSAILLQLKIAQ